MSDGSGNIKGSKTGLGIPNWFLELSGHEEPKVATEGTKAGVPSSGYHNDRSLKPSADGFTHSGLWKCDSAVPNSVFPDQQLVTDAFNGLPQEIRSSSLGRQTEEKLQNSITTRDEKLFEEAKREVEILLFYHDYEVDVRQAAQQAVLEHFPQGFPAEKINFEFFIDMSDELYDHEKLSNSAFVREFHSLSPEKKAALSVILFALKSPGFTDDNLLENPLLAFDKYEELNRWVEQRRDYFKAADLEGFLEKVKKTEEKEAQKDILLNDSARERLEIGSVVQQLAVLKRLEGHDNADTRAFLASVFIGHDNYLKGQESAKAEIEAAVTSPAQDFANIFVGEAHASELLVRPEPVEGRIIISTSSWFDKLTTNGRPIIETDRAIVRAALDKLAKDEELDPSILELAISFTKAEVKARLLGLAMQAGSAEVGGRLIDPVSETESLDLNGDGSKVQKILDDIDLASLVNSIDDSIKAVTEQEKLVTSMVGKEDIDKEWLKKRYQTLRDNYTAARRLLNDGRTEDARSRFLTLSNSPFAQSVNREFSESLDRSESIKFAGRIGIIVAAGVASSLTAGAAAPWLATALDLSAGQIAAANLFISSAAFMGAEKTLSYAALNELPYNPDASAWENVGLLTIEYLETVGMFKFLGMGNKAYAQFVERALFRRAESQLVKEGMIKWGEVYTSEAARALVLEKAELGIAGKILNAGGAFGAEYVSFSAWDLIVATGHYIAGDGSIDPTAVMSPEALEERGIFLFCLKLAGVIAMPITKPLHEMTARKILAKYKPQLWELAEEQGAVLKRLSEYKKSGREDAGEINGIFKELQALTKKRERLQVALVQSGMATVDQLAFTRSARKDAEAFEPKLKLLKDMVKLVTPKKANEWEYRPENRDDVREIIVRLITDHNAEVTEEKGVYKIKLSPEETLEIRPEGSPQAGSSATAAYPMSANGDSAGSYLPSIVIATAVDKGPAVDAMLEAFRGDPDTEFGVYLCKDGRYRVVRGGATSVNSPEDGARLVGHTHPKGARVLPSYADIYYSHLGEEEQIFAHSKDGTVVSSSFKKVGHGVCAYRGPEGGVAGRDTVSEFIFYAVDSANPASIEAEFVRIPQGVVKRLIEGSVSEATVDVPTYASSVHEDRTITATKGRVNRVRIGAERGPDGRVKRLGVGRQWQDGRYYEITPDLLDTIDPGTATVATKWRRDWAGKPPATVGVGGQMYKWPADKYFLVIGSDSRSDIQITTEPKLQEQQIKIERDDHKEGDYSISNNNPASEVVLEELDGTEVKRNVRLGASTKDGANEIILRAGEHWRVRVGDTEIYIDIPSADPIFTFRNTEARALRKKVEGSDIEDIRSVGKEYERLIERFRDGSPEAYEEARRLREMMFDRRIGVALFAADMYGKLSKRFASDSPEVYEGARTLRVLMSSPREGLEWHASDAYRELSDRFKEGSPEILREARALRDMMYDPNASVRRNTVDAYRALSRFFEAGTPEVYEGLTRLKELMNDRDHDEASSGMRRSAAITYSSLACLLEPGSHELQKGARVLRAMISDATLAAEYIDAVAAYARLIDQFSVADGEAVREEFFAIFGLMMRRNEHIRGGMLIILRNNFRLFKSLGLWEEAFDGEWVKGLRLSDDAVKNLKALIRHKDVIGFVDHWQTVLDYLSDMTEAKRFILERMLASGGKPRKILQAIRRLLNIPNDHRHEIMDFIEKMSPEWERESAGDKKAPVVATRVKEYIDEALIDYLRERVNHGGVYVLLETERPAGVSNADWQRIQQVRTVLLDSGVMNLFASAASFMNEAGIESLRRVLNRMARARVEDGRIVDLDRYAELYELMGFAREFVERWGADWQRAFDMVTGPKDQAQARKTVIEQASRQLAAHSKGVLAVGGEDANLPGRVAALRGRLESGDVSAEEARELSSYFDMHYQRIRKAYGASFANIRIDLQNLTNGLEGKVRVAKVSEEVEVAGRVDAIAKSGNEPVLTCQQLTGLHSEHTNGSGQPLNRILHGQFKIATYKMDGKVAARRHIEITRDMQGNVHLLVEQAYTGGQFAAIGRFDEAMYEYAEGLGIPRERVHFYHELTDVKPMSTGDAIYRDSWLETVEPDELPPQVAAPPAPTLGERIIDAAFKATVEKGPPLGIVPPWVSGLLGMVDERIREAEVNRDPSGGRAAGVRGGTPSRPAQGGASSKNSASAEMSAVKIIGELAKLFKMASFVVDEDGQEMMYYETSEFKGKVRKLIDKLKAEQASGRAGEKELDDAYLALRNIGLKPENFGLKPSDAVEKELKAAEAVAQQRIKARMAAHYELAGIEGPEQRSAARPLEGEEARRMLGLLRRWIGEPGPEDEAGGARKLAEVSRSISREPNGDGPFDAKGDHRLPKLRYDDVVRDPTATEVVGVERKDDLESRYRAEMDRMPGFEDAGVWYKWRGGLSRNMHGRIYFNVNMPAAAQFVRYLLDEVLVPHRRAITGFKIASDFKGVHSRADSAVLYFDSACEQVILDAVIEFARRHPEFTKDATPEFAAPLADDDGRPVQGVSFGEQPFDEEASFNGLRRDVLNEALGNARRRMNAGEGLTWGDVAGLIKEYLVRYGIDADAPAFNMGGMKSFPYIARHIYQRPVVDEGVTYRIPLSEPGVPELSSNGVVFKWPASKEEIVIGRGEGADIRVTERSASRVHTVIRRRPDGVYEIEHKGQNSIEVKTWQGNMFILRTLTRTSGIMELEPESRYRIEISGDSSEYAEIIIQ